MHRFRKSKKEKVKEEKTQEIKALDFNKAREDGEPSENPFAFMGPTKTKKKKGQQEQPQLDLTSALPSTDDFRTSLLMPKLSARFSMLRDQDDPDSLVGKASDDSVLFPKRASRLNLFGHNPSYLKDIDEVSQEGSRPSFALGRTDSYQSGPDGYGTDDDRSQSGIMSRGRRTEGNNLFGGRQKIYQIPVKPANPSPTADGPAPSGMGGRVVYDHDVNMSAYQRLRLKEKEDRAAEEDMYDYPGQESEDALSSISSAKRTTFSSTTSGPTVNGRISTAATSVDEQFPSPQAQTPTLEAQAFQLKPSWTTVAPERGSLRSRRLYGQGLTQSAQNQQNSALFRLENLSRQRSGTPDQPQMNRAFSRSAFNLRDRLQKLATAEPKGAHRPTSPPSSATSPGPLTIESDPKQSTNSPTHTSPPLSPPISESDERVSLTAALQPEDLGKATASGMFNKPKAVPFDETQFTRRQLEMHQGRSTPPLRRPPSPPGRATPQDRPRVFSDASCRSRADSVASSRYSEAQRTAENYSAPPSVEASPAKAGYGTFFASSTSASDSEDDGCESRDTSFDAVHPALRDNAPYTPATPHEESPNALPEVRFSDLGDLKPIAENDSAEENSEAADAVDPLPEKPDSPTLGPSGLGLSGLVHTHLRQNSDHSSIFPPPSPKLPSTDLHLDNPNAELMLEHIPRPAESNRDNGTNHSADDRGLMLNNATFESELRYTRHRREGSTETQKEREEFEHELAERRRKVQEKLKGIAESESRAGSRAGSRTGSRAASPTSGRQTPDTAQGRHGNAFALLKGKSGKNHPFAKPDQKNSKVFGSGNGSTGALVPDDHWREEDETLPFHFGRHPNASAPQVAPEKPSMRSRFASVKRSSNEDSRESSGSRGASPHSSFRSSRDRSGSDASGRSKSRSRYRERDDLGTLQEGSVVSHETFTFFDHHAGSVPGSSRPSADGSDFGMYDRSSSAASGRYYGSNRSTQYERPVFSPQPTNSPMITEPPRPSPMPLYSANPTPPLQELSHGPSAPAGPSTNHVIPQRAPGHHGLQKRAINKLNISEPTFISCTSNVPTVGLPPGASLSNGMENTPPVPPMNPRRRRQTTTQTVVSNFKGDGHESYYSQSSDPARSEEHSSFEDEENRRPKSRNRLRKTSSEGGSLHARARQAAMASPPPVLPSPPVPSPPQVDGGMF